MCDPSQTYMCFDKREEVSQDTRQAFVTSAGLYLFLGGSNLWPVVWIMVLNHLQLYSSC
jgi:hypothetical protein